MTLYNITQPLLTRAITLLQADTTLQGMVSGVYDYVPQAALLPYLRVSLLNARELPAGKQAVQQVSLVVDCWTNYRGSAEALQMSERVSEVLTLQAMQGLSSAALLSWYAAEQGMDVMNDAITRRIRLGFNALVQII